MAKLCTTFNSYHLAATSLVSHSLIKHFHSTAARDVVVIAGFGRFGQTVMEELQARAEQELESVVLIDIDADRRVLVAEEQQKLGGNYQRLILQGDISHPEVWLKLAESTDLGKDQPTIILGTGRAEENLRTALWIKRQYPNVRWYSLGPTTSPSWRWKSAPSTTSRQLQHQKTGGGQSAERLAARNLSTLGGRHVTEAEDRDAIPGVPVAALQQNGLTAYLVVDRRGGQRVDAACDLDAHSRVTPNRLYPAFAAKSRPLRKTVGVNVQDPVQVKAVDPNRPGLCGQFQITGCRSTEKTEISG